MLFQERSRFSAAYAFEGQLFLVPFQGPIDSGGTYRQEFGLDVGSDMEAGPALEKGHLFPQQGSQKLPRGVPKEGPDDPQGGKHLWSLHRKSVVGLDFYFEAMR
jgi:hypothetical protein